MAPGRRVLSPVFILAALLFFLTQSTPKATNLTLALLGRPAPAGMVCPGPLAANPPEVTGRSERC